MDVVAEYDDLGRRIEEAGFYARLSYPAVIRDGCILNVPSEEPPERLVVSSTPNDGNSFWVAKTGRGWAIGLWYPKLSLVPDRVDVFEVCSAHLRAGPRDRIKDLSGRTRRRFHLSEVPQEEWEDL